MKQHKFNLKAYALKAREMVAEGAVLLHNENKTLPFSKNSKVAVFGRSQFNYYKSGTGSGGLVNTGHVPNITEALETSGVVKVDQDVKAVYETWLKDHPYDAGHGWATEPWYQEEMPLDPSLVKRANEMNDGAIIILGRTAGEDKDNSATEGSYLLTKEELAVLETVCGIFDRVAVVLNTGNIIDMNWVDTYKPGAVIYVWQGGQEGGLGTADVLTGVVSPTGKLSDTVARSIDDYPAANNHGGSHRNIYQEDIYVGYRYFETFAPDKVIYPFGFGLTYTTFEVTSGTVAFEGNTMKFSAKVTNTGDAAAKEVVQVYAEAPQGKLGKAVRSLVAFGKTDLLAPGESETVNLSCSIASFASYDDSGVTGHKSCWVLEAGTYNFYIGTDVRSAVCAGNVVLQETVTQTAQEACAPSVAFDRLRPGRSVGGIFEKAYEPAPLQTESAVLRRNANLPAAREYTGDKGYKLWDVADGKVTLSQFVDQLSDEDLMCIVRGEGLCSPKVTPGTAGAFGGVTERLQEFGIPVACCADGPSGIRMDCGTKAFSMPNGTCQACSFNVNLVGELYEYEGMEMRKNKVDTLLGPGINLHRHPLNGRNFEYFSEDPLLTGKIAAAQLIAMQKYGVTGTIKHFACNSQELHRNDLEAVVSERALRELYLKSFEIAVKEGNAYSIMTSYNPINGWWSASNYDLLTVILRGEWGYQGQVMTDWWAKGNDEGMPGEGSNMAAIIRSQNDLYMVTISAENNTSNDNSAEAIAAGTVTRSEYLRSAENICKFLLKSPCLLHMQGIETEMDITLKNAPSFDDIFSGEMFFAEADENNRILLDVSKLNLTKGSATQFSVTPNKHGRYVMNLTLRSTDDNDISQLPLSIYQDGELLGTVALNGAEREWKTVSFDIICTDTVYLRFYAAQTGLDIQSCVLELVQSVEE